MLYCESYQLRGIRERQTEKRQGKIDRARKREREREKYGERERERERESERSS